MSLDDQWLPFIYLAILGCQQWQLNCHNLSSHCLQRLLCACKLSKKGHSRHVSHSILESLSPQRNWSLLLRRPPHLMLSSAVCFVFLFLGYCGLAASPEVITTCLSTMLRSFGSSVLWVYSTLLLQLRVPDQLLGRMLALEVAFFTVGRLTIK